MAEEETGVFHYRKKPVVIEAAKLSWANFGNICKFIPKPWFKEAVYLDSAAKERLPEGQISNTLGLLLQTLESQEFLVQEGDYIIKGVNGEFYACKPDVFAKTYEREYD
jgi:hypothetical protein